MKVAIETMPPFLMAGIRFFTAGAVLYMISRLSGAKRPAGREWRSSAVVGALLSVFSYFTGDWSKLDVSSISLRSYAALGYLVLFGSIVGYTAYVWLLKNADPTLVSTYAFVNPIVAVFLGWLLAGEQLTVNTLTAAVIIIAAVVLVTIFRSRVVPVSKEHGTLQVNVKSKSPLRSSLPK